MRPVDPHRRVALRGPDGLCRGRDGARVELTQAEPFTPAGAAWARQVDEEVVPCAS